MRISKIVYKLYPHDGHRHHQQQHNHQQSVVVDAYSAEHVTSSLHAVAVLAEEASLIRSVSLVSKSGEPHPSPGQIIADIV